MKSVKKAVWMFVVFFAFQTTSWAEVKTGEQSSKPSCQELSNSPKKSSSPETSVKKDKKDSADQVII